MSDLDTMLNTTMKDLPPSLPAPPGRYRAVVRRYEAKTSGKNDTPVAVLTIKLLEPLDGQDMSGVNLRENSGLVDHKVWLTEKGVDVFTRTAKKSFGIETKDRPVRDVLDELVGRECIAVVKHEDYKTKDGDTRVWVEAAHLNKLT